MGMGMALVLLLVQSFRVVIVCVSNRRFPLLFYLKPLVVVVVVVVVLSKPILGRLRFLFLLLPKRRRAMEVTVLAS